MVTERRSCARGRDGTGSKSFDEVKPSWQRVTGGGPDLALGGCNVGKEVNR